ncbi:cell-cycle control medial ring component-domain-containing protein [Chaetomidium leptoderma]|uniref:Cell-cycle control medial ring component-domain-containing protein n=1 Tax=Chaetomidium leptoderma TaxID=669021 RepID=A0AAN6VP70_9PEZI|nr:cell-cycle control medial ring component-domain-containing protein [Chaetomidium leptoderma]
MATELTFAKTFLSLLDSKPAKISPDHVEDPRSYPGSSPYTLPRLPSQKPFSTPSSSSTTTGTTTTTTTPPSKTKPTPGSSSSPSAASITVHLRSPRNPPFDLTPPAQTPTTSLAEIKEQVARETGLPLAKIKLLHGKKPVGDSKALKDLLLSLRSSSEDGGDKDEGVVVELGVMVLEEEEEKKKESSVDAPVAQGLSGTGVLETGQFWEDLEGFLQHRVRDEGVAGEALGLFRGAWEGRSS